ncbi:hypothetical protein [Vibrio anguillarum]|uniref:hypothetical protein n=1 Tax=Vibrio anguillarum TaxID=55601 RepID=UPI001C9BE7D8|nr:hypothetical protein [Vibrio anguillarum]
MKTENQLSDSFINQNLKSAKKPKNSNLAIWKKNDERSILGGRLNAEGYFAAVFTALSNPIRSRNNKYVMIIHCLT